jgi:hypothetical protein
MLMNLRWRFGLLAFCSAVGTIAANPILASSESASKPIKLSINATQRSAYAVVPLSSLKGSLASGDVSQLPLIVLSSSMGQPKRLPKVEFDRSNPTRIVALVTYLGLEDDSIKNMRYRVEMVPSDSLCSCQRWEVSWVGRQQQCQSGRGSQEWTAQACS